MCIPDKQQSPLQDALHDPSASQMAMYLLSAQVSALVCGLCYWCCVISRCVTSDLRCRFVHASNDFDCLPFQCLNSTTLCDGVSALHALTSDPISLLTGESAWFSWALRRSWHVSMMTGQFIAVFLVLVLWLHVFT